MPITRKNVTIATAVFAGLIVLVFISCGRSRSKDPEAPEGASAAGENGSVSLATASFEGSPEFDLALFEPEDPQREDFERPPRAEAEELTRAQRAAVLDRLPALETREDDEKARAIREGSKPPPRTGETIETRFPPDDEWNPPETSAAEEEGPLRVLRYAPEGDVPLAPQVSVTFSEPMVEVSSQALAKAKAPLRIEPEVAGNVRWVGTRTLLFEPEGERFPMATQYQVEVPAETSSAAGETLDEATRFRFETPTVKVASAWPKSSSRRGRSPRPRERDQVMFLEFNQRIDRDALADFIELEADGKELDFAWLDREELENELDEDDPPRRRLHDENQNLKDRWVAFRASEPLPYDARITYGLKAGAPSAEGPLETESAQRIGFRTYGPLELGAARCGHHRQSCRPTTPVILEFSNRLDAGAFDASMVEIEPETPELDVSASGSSIRVTGHKRGRESYRFTVSGELRDRHGQTLGGEETAEVEVGPAPPWLASPAGALVVADPGAEPEVSFRSVNHKRVELSVYEVKPSHWGDYLVYRRERSRSRYRSEEAPEPPKPPGRLLEEKTLAIEGEPDVPTDTRIGLGTYLGEDLRGHLVVTVDVSDEATREPYGRTGSFATWVQATDMAIDAFADGRDLVGWATSLESGEALSGVRLSLPPSGEEATTDEEGIARLSLPARDGGGHAMLKATRGEDVAFLPGREHARRGSGPLGRSAPGDELRWYVADDRATYRPGEKVSVKGWLRRIENEPSGDVRLESRAERIEYAVKDSRGNEFATGQAETTALGGFDLSFEIPKTPNLGAASLSLSAPEADVRHKEHRHTFSIEEFRRPEFEVEAELDESGPFFVGESAVASASASYYAGGPLPGAQTRWDVSAQPGSFSPPGQSDYAFGVWTPWWRSRSPGTAVTSETWDGKTDALGRHRLEMDLGTIDPPQPMAVTATATVTDVNRQAWSSNASFLVHPGEHYVGLKSDRYFVERGDPLNVEAIVADLEGEIVEGRAIEITAARVSWGYLDGEYRQELGEEQRCRVESAKEPVTCEFDTDAGGRYAVTAVTRDDKGRESATRISRWVSGGTRPVARDVEQETVELIPDRDEYAPGDTAEILVSSPFSPGEAMLTLRRNGIVRSERFSLGEGTTSIEIPIEEAHMPNLHVQVDAVGKTTRLDDEGDPEESLPPRPAFASGTLNLEVSTEARTLELDVEPAAEEVVPGASTSARVRVRDHAGTPVEGAEVAVFVVDEAILALSDYSLADPMDVFYRGRPSGVSDLYLRKLVALADPAELEPPASRVESDAMRSRAPPPAREAAADGAGTGGEAKATSASPIDVRRDFDPLAAFVPAAYTGEDGEVSVDLEMPDSLTRYRVMAVAAEGEHRFGAGEDSITARRPLMVRPSTPRFLNYGDEAELPVVLQNQTEEAMRVHVAARAANLELESVAGKAVEIPGNERAEVRFPAKAQDAGTARVQFGAAAGPHADAAEVEIPVWTPATTEAFATYGELDEGAITQPVRAPPDALPEFGALEISTSSTALQALTDAFLELFERDYEQTERIASRMIAVAALRDVLQAFAVADTPSGDEMDEAMAQDIDELVGRQAANGGFGLWYRGGETFPFISLHAAHALARAEEKGYDVPEHVRSRASRYLETISRHIPPRYSEKTRRVILAYALAVRALLGDSDPAQARELLERAEGPEGLPLVAVGWVYRAIANEPGASDARERIVRYLQNRVTETAASAHFVDRMSTEEEYLILHSDRRADAVILEALVEDRPRSDLIPKLARGLLAHRTRGRWQNSQENSFVLLALDRYFRTYETQTPDFVARAWLGDDYAGQHAFRGRSTERHRTRIPMRYLAESGEDSIPVHLQKRGKGRLYYRIGMSYAPEDLDLDAADHGFAVERRYRAVDDPADVRRREDGTWVIRAGARVEIEIQMVAPTRRYHVALVDPLPAGLEAQNPGLAVTADVPDTDEDEGDFWWFTRPWYQHQNLRDERAEAFSTLVWGGVHSYSYVARATTPGRFVAPPAKAEEMYHPETFGRSPTARVHVVDDMSARDEAPDR